jgi:putative glycosyltransferase (TIGR04348 family)
MRILIVTPARPGSRHGNRNTATRWARLLRASDHQVDIVVDAGEARGAHDLMIALHARRSAASIALWKSNPQRPLILALTGTDLYRDIRTDAAASESTQLADAMVVLQVEGLSELAPGLRAKTRVVHQSARAVQRVDPPSTYCLITVIGHLRDEKDPLRAALALRHLPDASRIRIVQIGRELDPALGQQARALAAADPRYRWLGELPHGDAMRWLARSHAMVISSRMEGGAHVVSEAIACGVPVLASRIPGNRGLLGPDYPGYFTTENEADLAQLMLRIEQDKRFVLGLERGIARRRHLVDAEAERSALAALVQSVMPTPPGRGARA